MRQTEPENEYTNSSGAVSVGVVVSEAVPVLSESNYFRPIQSEIQNANSSSVLPQEEVACCSLDPSILKWNLENWVHLPREEADKILFQFWMKTSSDKFPFTMNLVLTPHPFTNCALAGFMLLFSEGTSIYKKGVRWITMETAEVGTVKVQLIWWDPVNYSSFSILQNPLLKHKVLGIGELLTFKLFMEIFLTDGIRSHFIAHF